jgi:hypothetical protein
MFLVSGVAVAIQADGDGGDVFTDAPSLPWPSRLPGGDPGAAIPRVCVRTIGSALLFIVPVAAVCTLIERNVELKRRLLNHALQDLYQLQMEVCRLKLRSSTRRPARYLLELAAERHSASPVHAAAGEKVHRGKDRLHAGEPVPRFRGVAWLGSRNAAWDGGYSRHRCLEGVRWHVIAC